MFVPLHRCENLPTPHAWAEGESKLQASWPAIEPHTLLTNRRRHSVKGSEEGGTLPSGETTVGFLAQEAFSSVEEMRGELSGGKVVGSEAETQKEHRHAWKEKDLGLGQGILETIIANNYRGLNEDCVFPSPQELCEVATIFIPNLQTEL